eukprot:GGOE01014850.1.p1 GENE.GGOE01014850.1~~GGOE01014850.1.p1  ORF type:complete len:542 (-),score=86.04 GGOE01014850.1:356-1981(-)
MFPRPWALAPLLFFFIVTLWNLQNGPLVEVPATHPTRAIATLDDQTQWSDAMTKHTMGVTQAEIHWNSLAPFSPECCLTPQLQEYIQSHSAACKSQRPEAFKSISRLIVGLEDGQPISSGPAAFLIHATSAGSIPRCGGGNYYEVRMESTKVDEKSLVAVALSTMHIDLGNGLHCINFHPVDAGAYRADVLLAWEGEPEDTVVPVHRKLVNREVGTIHFVVKSTAQTPVPLHICASFAEGNIGRWVRLRGATCQEPFCTGNLHMVSREGWVFVPHSCHYHLYEHPEAWQCMAGKYLLFTGDSTMQEDYLEFLKQALNVREGDKVNGPTWKKFRNYDRVVANPRDRRQRVRVQMVWNGHPEHYGLHWGLRTYTDRGHQERLQKIFQGANRPDFVFINSGMHDVFLYNITLGIYDTLHNYSQRLRFAIDFLQGIPGRGNSTFIWRATKVPAGPKYRNWYINPHKYLQGPLIIDGTVRIAAHYIQTKPWLEYLDAWSLTFPFHWDDLYSDGHHYSATKNKMVEYMYLQTLLNRMCRPSAPKAEK